MRLRVEMIPPSAPDTLEHPTIMNRKSRPFRTCIVCLITLESCFAQKVQVGYDKTADFSKYKTYTRAAPTMPPTRPVLYQVVIDSIDNEMSSKGFTKIDKDGDLTMITAGGVEYGNNVAAGTPMIGTYSGPPPSMNATMWTGAEGPSSLQGPMVPQGTLVLELVDRSTNNVVWTGSVSQKLDIEKKEKSLELVGKAVVKLLKQFPPRSSSSK
jgi:hypothetical protein